jgi:general secretion pathway protein B
MSYILDALRKSDQQRQRGAAPTLQMVPPAAVEPKRPAYLSYGVLAAVLLGAGVAIGWLRPWQAEPSPPAANVVAARPSAAVQSQPVPARTEIAPPVTPQPQTAAPAAQIASAPAPLPAQAAAPAPAPVRAPVPAAVTAPVQAPAPAARKSQQAASVRPGTHATPQETAARAPQKAARPESPPAPASADSAPAQNIILLADLPLALQQELPPMTVSVHAYSARPADRMVGINNRMLREGDEVVPGLKLEQITPEGMVFGYKGYSFRRGVK